MKIEINTNGHADNTVILIDGEQVKVSNFKIQVLGGDVVKLNMTQEIGGKIYPLSFYGNDIKNYDRANKVEKGK